MWRLAALTIMVLVLAMPGRAQTWTQAVHDTADREDWYLSGAPLLLDGTLYYQSGAITHFNANEMVRSGYLGAVPIYTRTTYEPRSIVFVPLAGGLVRPYERRRDGELAGTVGSTAPGFPVSLPSAAPPDVAPPLGAAGPPTGSPVGMWGVASAERTRTVTVRQSETDPAAAVTIDEPTTASGVLRTARPAIGINAAFIEFQDARWFLAGPAVLFDEGRFQRAGDYFDFPVYRDPARPGVVYVPVVDGSPGLVTPYMSR